MKTNEQILHDRLNAYEKVILTRIERVRRRIDSNIYDDDDGNRVWLEKFTKGKGLDVCCGHIVLDGAEGVDIHPFSRTSGCLGPLCYIREGDDLGNFEKEGLDFVVSNYMEAFSSPLKVLHEWNRVLRIGGTLALIVSNAERYKAPLGPFCNRNKCNVFTPTTIRFYLAKSGFNMISLEEINKAMRILAEKT